MPVTQDPARNEAARSSCDDGLMIDLSLMKRIRVDPARRIARAEAGLLLGEFDARPRRTASPPPWA